MAPPHYEYKLSTEGLAIYSKTCCGQKNALGRAVGQKCLPARPMSGTAFETCLHQRLGLLKGGRTLKAGHGGPRR